MRRYTKLFLGLMVVFWIKGVIFIYLDVGHNSIPLVLFILGGISLALAERSWSERRRIEHSMERFGYPPAPHSKE